MSVKLRSLSLFSLRLPLVWMMVRVGPDSAVPAGLATNRRAPSSIRKGNVYPTMTTVDHIKPKGSKGGTIVNGSRGFYVRLTVSYTTHIESERLVECFKFQALVY